MRKELTREGLDLRIMELQRNFGQAAGLQAGIDAARAPLVPRSTATSRTTPTTSPRWSRALRADLDLLCGWRKERHDGLVLRLIPSWIANSLIRKVTRRPGATIMAAG